MVTSELGGAADFATVAASGEAGDSAAAAKQLGYKQNFSHVSTGGGASLEMIENNGHLPGVDVLR